MTRTQRLLRCHLLQCNEIQGKSNRFNSIKCKSIHPNSLQAKSMRFNSIQPNAMQVTSFQFNSTSFDIATSQHITSSHHVAFWSAARLILTPSSHIRFNSTESDASQTISTQSNDIPFNRTQSDASQSISTPIDSLCAVVTVTFVRKGYNTRDQCMNGEERRTVNGEQCRMLQQRRWNEDAKQRER